MPSHLVQFTSQPPTQEQIAERYDTDQEEVSRHIKVGQDKRFITISYTETRKVS